MNEQLANAGLRVLPPSNNHDEETLGQISVDWFGEERNVHVIFRLDEPSADPTSPQIEAFQQFMDNRALVLSKIEEQLTEYYDRARVESSLDQETVADLFPSINSPSELGSMVDLRGIIFSYYDGDWSSYVGILAECDWEEEHGLGIKVVKES